MRRTPALIVGAGPAGTAAAIALGRAGMAANLLERGDGQSDALCGGFLSWRTVAALRAIGVDPAALGGQAARKVRLFAGDQIAIAALPGTGFGLSRRTLDQALAAAAVAVGAGLEHNVAVRRLDPDGRLVLADGTVLAADPILLATGKHDLRGAARPAGAAGRDPAVGLRTRLAPTPALTRLVAGAIELHLFDGGYGGLVLQEDGSANLCLAVRRSRLVDAGGRPEALLERIADRGPLGERIGVAAGIGGFDAVANVPYGWRATNGTPGLFRLGDQAAVIPSLAGEGIGIALASGQRAAAAMIAGGRDAAPVFQRRLAAATRRPVGIAAAILALAERPAIARPAVRLLRAAPGIAQGLAALTRMR